jgi:hypothetical protein
LPLKSVVLQEIIKISAITQKLADALFLLQEKQNPLPGAQGGTLEDKVITKCFLELLHTYSLVLGEFCCLLEKADLVVDHSTNGSAAELLTKLQDLNLSADLLLDGCLKALQHNYNYFEQYYQYDFITKFKKQEFSSQLLELVKKIRNLPFGLVCVPLANLP